MKNQLFASLALACLSILNSKLSTLHAQSSAFTYQGRLADGANAASGVYDLRFTIYETSGGSTVVAGPVTNSAAAVSNGLFTATLDPGPGVFTGAERWLEIAVRTNSASLFTILSPRQKITATPYAITAGNLSGPLIGASLSGTYPNAVTLNNPANSFSGNAANLTTLNASQLANGTVPAAALSNAWRIGGNEVAPGQFIGSTNYQPLDFKVFNWRGLRLEPTPFVDTVNVIGGSAANAVGAGVAGATIGGGGAGDYIGFAYTNRVDANFGTLSGGAQNTIQTNADFATIGGGGANTIQTNAHFATIPGGRENSAAEYAFAAGRRAKANHIGAFVWADATDTNFASTASNQFLIRATGNVGINKTNPATALDVNGTITATSFSGDGAGLTSLNAANLTGSVPGAALTSVPAGNLTGTVPTAALSNAWRSAGNEVAPGQFIGSTNNQALDFKVSNQRALRLEPTANTDTVNVIGGSARNSVGAGAVGATIGGGGAGDYSGFAYTNRVEASFGTVAGGLKTRFSPTPSSRPSAGAPSTRFRTVPPSRPSARAPKTRFSPAPHTRPSAGAWATRFSPTPSTQPSPAARITAPPLVSPSPPATPPRPITLVPSSGPMPRAGTSPPPPIISS